MSNHNADLWGAPTDWEPRSKRDREQGKNPSAFDAGELDPAIGETYRVELIAYCPEHGLHGGRTECFTCGAPVVQIPMVSAAEVERLRANVDRARGLAEAIAKATPYPPDMDGVRGIAAEIAALLTRPDGSEGER